MGNKCFVLLLLLQNVLLLAAQDVILKTNGDELQAKVLEIGEVEVKYKSASNPTGPTYTIDKANVFMIKYGNGEKDFFGQGNKTTNAASTTNTNAANASSVSASSLAATPVTATIATTPSTAVTNTTNESRGANEWTIFRSSPKAVTYTIKARIPNEIWDY